MGQSPTPDPSWKGLPPWLFFAFLVFGPPAALVAFTRTVTQNPLLIALIVFGYWVLLFLGHLARKIWQQLEEPFIEHIARWITIRAQEVTSRYYRQYFYYVEAEHQIFDMKGLSTRTAHDLALERVFVDLLIHPLPPHQANTDPIRLPEALQGAHSIWEYLSNPMLANPHLVILGAPGSGKTTLLKHLALTLAQPKKSRRRLTSHFFPILLFLRDHAQTIADQPNFSLAEAVEEHIQRKWQQTIPSSWIHRSLERGKCLILLDGLDEVANNSTRRKVVDWVGRQLVAYGHNHFVLTSRPYGYRENPLDGVTVLDVQPFTPDQIERFIQNWYLANELKSWGKDDASVHMQAREGTQDLLKRLHQAPALLSLAVNPLLLTMIATVHRYRGSLPGKRVDLYAEICEVFLGKRHEARGIIDELSPTQKRLVLQPLAYSMMQQGTREISYEEALKVIEPALMQVNTQMQTADFLRLIENASGLLLEKKPGLYGFAHLTFQEYLTAVHIKEDGVEHVLTDQVTNSWWHETIRLYCAQADATAVIQACLAGSPPSVETLVLAYECDEEKLKLQPQIQAQLNAILKTGIEDADPERRRVIAEVLLTRRLRQMIPLQQEAYIDTSLITCAEYQVFLDEQRAQNLYHQPDHWTTFSVPKGSGSTPVLGVRHSDAKAFCEWLTARDREGWRYRLPRTGEERPVEERELWKGLNAETGYWTVDEPRFEWVQGKVPANFQQLLGFDPALISDLAFNHDSDYVFVGDLIRSLNYGLAHAPDLAHALGDALPSADALNLNDYTRYHLAPDLDLARTRARNFGSANALDLDCARARAYDLARDLAHACARARALDSAHALDSTRNSIQALARAHDLAHDLAHALDSARDNVLACTLACTLPSTLANAYTSVHAIGTRASARDLARTGDLVRDLADALDSARALYVTLHRLQRRIAGDCPAYEGVLLVKERQQRNSSAEV